MNETTTRILTILAAWPETLKNDYALPATDMVAFCNALLVADESGVKELIDFAERAQQKYHEWRAVPVPRRWPSDEKSYTRGAQQFEAMILAQKALSETIDRIQRAA